jgi:hypothetical protein
MPDPDYKALCAELLVALKSWSPHGGGPLECWEDREEEADLIARAEAELAQPEPVAPTDEEIYKLALEGDFLVDVGDGFSCMVHDEVEFARAVLDRWGTPANNTREESFDA